MSMVDTHKMKPFTTPKNNTKPLAEREIKIRTKEVKDTKAVVVNKKQNHGKLRPKVVITWNSDVPSLEFASLDGNIMWEDLNEDPELWEKLCQAFSFLMDYIDDYEFGRGNFEDPTSYEDEEELEHFSDITERSAVDRNVWSRFEIFYTPKKRELLLSLSSSVGCSNFDVDLNDEETWNNLQDVVFANEERSLHIQDRRTVQENQSQLSLRCRQGP